MSDSPLSMNLYAEDWLKHPLIKVSEFIKDGTHGTHERVNIGVPLLSAKNITSYGSITIDEEDSRISNDDYQKIHSKYEIQKNDLLITVVGTLGRRALADGVHKFSIQRSVGVVRCDTTKIFPEFLYHFTGSDYFQNQLTLRSNATAQAGVYLGELAKIDIAIPPLPEQQKIATILTSVDTVIEKTRAQIDKLKHLKTGMMQELLTKGIGHTEFKDSPVGRIPLEWKIFSMEEILDTVIDYRGKSPPKSEAGVPLITAKNIRQGYIDIDPKEYIYEDQYESWMVRGFPIEGDVFITTEAPLGNVARVPTYKFAIGQRVLTLRPKEFVATDYLFYMMQGQYFREQLDLESTGSTVAGIKQSTFRNILVPLPSKAEQLEIAKPLNALNRQIDIVQKKLKGMEVIKKALMQDLLTGKIRVNA